MATEYQNCTWIGTVSQLDSHLLTCDWVEAECPNVGCHQLMQRKLISQHSISDCDYRCIACEFCESKMLFYELANHLDLDCEYKPFQCRNGCNEITNNRDLNTHLQVCELQLIKCPYFQSCVLINCEGTIQRQFYNKHLCHPENIVTMMTSMNSKINSMEQTLAKLTTANLRLEKEILNKSEDMFVSGGGDY
eukprot:gene6808-9323_t